MSFDLGRTFSGVMDWAGGLFGGNEDQVANPMMAGAGAGVLGFLMSSLSPGGNSLTSGFNGLKYALIATLATLAINWIANQMNGPGQDQEYAEDYTYEAE